jgi:uncharacterized membrane protein
MASDNSVLIYVAVYDTADDAKSDYDAVKELHEAGVIGTYDVALVTRDQDGDVHIRETEKPTEYGAAVGLASGGVIGGVAAGIAGVFIPPIALAGAAAGALGGGVIGHVRAGLPRKDLRELGDSLQNNEASVVVVAEPTLSQAVETALSRASRRIEKQINRDIQDVKKALDDAAKTKAVSV